MGRGRHAGYEGQRELIVAQAAALFARGGYPGTSMNQVALACGLSKATLYHYYRDKYELLVNIAEGHVTRLQCVVEEVLDEEPTPPGRMRVLIRRLVEEYANAQDAHRVLTEDVKFLQPADRERILDKEREVVAAFARVITALRPELQEAAMGKPLTMLLFGMVNWMFTWMRPDGALAYDDMAPVVTDLFLGGLEAVRVPVNANAQGGFRRRIPDAEDAKDTQRTQKET